MKANSHEIILLGPMKPLLVKGLEAIGTVHKSAEAKDLHSFYAAHPNVRAIACAATSELLGDAFMRRCRLCAMDTHPLIVETPHSDRFPVGACVYALPWHVCPTVALHQEVWVVDGGVARKGSVRLRGRETISIEITERPAMVRRR